MKSLKLFSWSNTFRFESNKKQLISNLGVVHILGPLQQKKRVKLIQTLALPWQCEDLLKSKKDLLSFVSANGPVWILTANAASLLSSKNALASESSYALLRDLSGSLVAHFKNSSIEKVQFYFDGLSLKYFEALILGLDLASYNYKGMESADPFADLPEVSLPILNASMKKVFDRAQAKARAVNRARHLVNMPANECNPDTIEKMLKSILPKNLKMEVWQSERLQKERMYLHFAVGQGSLHLPRMIHLKYRGSSKAAPIAFVGKGITFDTGGLDLKPSSAMRLMKKDMGGAASVLGLALFVAEAKIPQSCDFYLALAENSVDQLSFRPGDVYNSRAGYQVEIDNTDAEGRLVLADVLDVAVTKQGKDEPTTVIDVATLTGACRVALGTDVAGLFSNDDKLATELMSRGHGTGDYCWQLPLVERFFGSYSTHFADFKNAGDGMGGAITAAVFLQKFVRGKKWAHLDAYCWADKPTGSYSFPGGNGQTVQLLIDFLLK